MKFHADSFVQSRRVVGNHFVSEESTTERAPVVGLSCDDRELDNKMLAKFGRGVKKGPSCILGSTKHTEDTTEPDVFVFLCRCPACVIASVTRAFTVTFPMSAYETVKAKDWNDSTDPQTLILDEDGFVSFHHRLPAGPTSRNYRGRVYTHFKEVKMAYPD